MAYLRSLKEDEEDTKPKKKKKEETSLAELINFGGDYEERSEGGVLVGKDTGKTTQVGRKVYETDEGEMVSEKSTTFKYKGKWINIPSIVMGEQLTDDELKELLDEGLVEPTSIHDKLEDAEKAARKRSDSLEFSKGGTTMDKQMDMFGKQGGLYDEGGEVDKESGNDVPIGSLQEEVRDDIPAMLSEGEFVLPADVVRYHGLEKIMMLRDEAKFGLKKMEAMGQMGNADEATLPDDVPFSMEDLVIVVGPDEEQEKPQKKNEGGVIHAQAGSLITPSQPAGTFTAPTTTQSNMGLAGFQGSMYGNQTTIGQPTIGLPVMPPMPTPVPTPPEAAGSYTPPTVLADPVDRPEFVPDVTDQYKPVKYINPTSGETMMINEYQGNPVSAVPAGFIRYDDYIAQGGEDPTTDIDDTGIDTSVETTQVTQGGGDDDDKSAEKKKLDDLKRETEKVRVDKFNSLLTKGSDEWNNDPDGTKLIEEYKKAKVGQGIAMALPGIGLPASLLARQNTKKIEAAMIEKFGEEEAKKKIEEIGMLDSAKDTLGGFTKGITSAFLPTDDPDNFYNQYNAKYDISKLPGNEGIVGFTKDAAGNPTGNLTVKEQQAFDNAVDRGDTAITNHFSMVAKGNAARDQFAIDNAEAISEIQKLEKGTIEYEQAFNKLKSNNKVNDMYLGDSSIEQVIEYGSSVHTAINLGKAEKGGFLKPAKVTTDSSGNKNNSPITSKTDSGGSKKATTSKPSKDKSKNIASSGRSEKDIQKEINKKIKDATDASGNVNWVKADVGNLVKERDSARKNEGTKTTTAKTSGGGGGGGSKPSPAAASGGCCFIMLEARYGDGTMDEVVRRYRDEHMTDRNRRGYYKVAEVFVPLMRKSRMFKWLVTKTFADPLVSYGKYYYGQNKHGVIYSPIKSFWMKVFDIVGGDTEFIRENGEVV